MRSMKISKAILTVIISNKTMYTNKLGMKKEAKYSTGMRIVIKSF